MPTIRVVRVTSNHFGEYNHGSPVVRTEQVVWEGSDVDELSRLHPPSQIFGADDLRHSQIEDGLIRFDYRFERDEEGTWVKIDDPRRRITPVTEAERETDAENRRLYPGDYQEHDGFYEEEDF